MKLFHFFQWDFHDHPIEWEPEDQLDFDFWVTVNVGDGEAGNYYQIHVCSPSAVSRVSDKRATFVLSMWQGPDSLVSALNGFIAENLNREPSSDPYELMSRHWLWEYENYRPAT